MYATATSTSEVTFWTLKKGSLKEQENVLTKVNGMHKFNKQVCNSIIQFIHKQNWQ